MMTNNCGIYKITNTVTGDFYIGSAVDLCKRFRNHRYTLFGNCHRNAHLQNAWNKYGEDKFSFEVVLYCDKSMTLFYEQVLLDGLNPTYNIAKDAFAPFQERNHTEETLQRMSEVKMGESNAFFGKHHTEESKRKISEAFKGCIFTEEHKRKIGEAQKGNTRALGCKHTDEAKRKHSEAMNRRWAQIKAEAC